MDSSLEVYLAGEIHSAWREQLIETCRTQGVPASFSSPVTDHDASDSIGEDILGTEQEAFWRDRKSAGINSIRIRTCISKCDVCIVRFGDKYRQWNAAFEAGIAVALGKPIIVMHSPELTHALKDLDAVAAATVETPEQAAKVLNYVCLQP